MNDEMVSVICKALSDQNRLKITKLLTRGEMCACELLEEFNISQPTLSHHMKVLSDAQLVMYRKEGKNTYYRINCDTYSGFREYINQISCCDRSSCNCKQK